MYYLEYIELRKKFKEAEDNYYDALTKRSDLLYLVTPHSIEIKPIVNHLSGEYDAGIVTYSNDIDEMDKLINSARNDKDMLNYELKKKEKDLRESKNVYDMIYVYKWLEHKSVYKFKKLIGYSKSQIYNYIADMKLKIYPKTERLDKIGQK